MWVLNKICGICATNYSIHLKLTQKINPNASAFTNISQCTRIPQFAASFNSLNALLAESVPFVCCKLKNYITPSGTIEHMYARYTHTHAVGAKTLLHALNVVFYRSNAAHCIITCWNCNIKMHNNALCRGDRHAHTHTHTFDRRIYSEQTAEACENMQMPARKCKFVAIS